MKIETIHEWHIEDVGTVTVDMLEPNCKFVNLCNIGYSLGITASEARKLAGALMAAADEVAPQPEG